MPLSNNGDLKITVSLDDLTIGDLELLESGSIKAILEVFDHTVTVEGSKVRDLHYTTLRAIATEIRNAVEAEANPVTAGKN